MDNSPKRVGWAQIRRHSQRQLQNKVLCLPLRLPDLNASFFSWHLDLPLARGHWMGWWDEMLPREKVTSSGNAFHGGRESWGLWVNLPAAREKGERNQWTSRAPIPPTWLSPLEIGYGRFFLRHHFFFLCWGWTQWFRHARYNSATGPHLHPPLPPPPSPLLLLFFD